MCEQLRGHASGRQYCKAMEAAAGSQRQCHAQPMKLIAGQHYIQHAAMRAPQGSLSPAAAAAATAICRHACMCVCNGWARRQLCLSPARLHFLGRKLTRPSPHQLPLTPPRCPSCPRPHQPPPLSHLAPGWRGCPPLRRARSCGRQAGGEGQGAPRGTLGGIREVGGGGPARRARWDQVGDPAGGPARSSCRTNVQLNDYHRQDLAGRRAGGRAGERAGRRAGRQAATHLRYGGRLAPSGLDTQLPPTIHAMAYYFFLPSPPPTSSTAPGCP